MLQSALAKPPKISRCEIGMERWGDMAEMKGTSVPHYFHGWEYFVQINVLSENLKRELNNYYTGVDTLLGKFTSWPLDAAMCFGIFSCKGTGISLILATEACSKWRLVEFEECMTWDSISFMLSAELSVRYRNISGGKTGRSTQDSNPRQADYEAGWL